MGFLITHFYKYIFRRSNKTHLTLSQSERYHVSEGVAENGSSHTHSVVTRSLIPSAVNVNWIGNLGDEVIPPPSCWSNVREPEGGSDAESHKILKCPASIESHSLYETHKNLKLNGKKMLERC